MSEPPTSSALLASHRRRSALAGAPPEGLVLIGIVSVQVGAATAKSLFSQLGPAGVTLLRLAIAALVLLAIWRPSRRGLTPARLGLVAAFGATLGVMNLGFYEALQRIPLGAAVTIEFVGPLGVAVAGSRRRLDALWVVLAAGGILLLAERGSGVNLAGALLALLAGTAWAAYILLAARVGAEFPGGGGLALAMSAGTLVVLPFGLAGGGHALLIPHLLLAGAGVAILSSVVPYSLELQALRRMPPRVFGVLMSLEPAVAAVAGLVVLGERLVLRACAAILLVVVACIGSTATSGRREWAARLAAGEAGGGG
ncbi:MAG: EamA family transporter [Candidatus Dormibacteria bacterium]